MERRLAPFFPFRRGHWPGILVVAHSLVPGGEIFQFFGSPWIESFRGRRIGEEREVVPTGGLKGTIGRGLAGRPVDVRRREVGGQAGEGLPLVYSIHGAPNGDGINSCCLTHLAYQQGNQAVHHVERAEDDEDQGLR